MNIISKITLFFVAVCFVFAACEEDCPVNYYYADQTDYNVDAYLTTPDGLDLDASGLPIDPILVDRLTRETEDCLIENFGNPPVIPPEVVEAAACRHNSFDLPIERECLTVKIPDDCFLSHDNKQELLPAEAPDYICEAKGLSPDEGHSCHWRAGIQDNWTIVSCPSLYLYKDPLIRIATGCNDLWKHPLLARCAAPSTSSLSGLVIE